ncbi:hypothetical protein [Hymenobacter weizhouensis]|uniref:hypothetical protein n=1 Tax=Hymenobacter sp. YIM 151500-1 TaxID=2987689 RepID=UPI002227A369|nr:hypothetical protein [Hymenobacter sp. YIM 151500-1]UYZ62799.1 hypothetical protein OIS53_17600 [Hymenobacter sp. YIM 151500-1]
MTFLSFRRWAAAGLVLGATAPLLSNAQSFTPGYLVRAAGDTVRGELENGFWEDAPATLRFRTAPAAAVQEVSTRSLRGFGLSQGRFWRRQYLTYDAAAESRRDLTQLDAPRSRLVSDSLLTEVLVQGPVLLTVAFRGTTPHYFVQQTDRPPLELVARTYRRTGPDGRQYFSAVNNYKEQLRLYLPECPALAGRWEKLRFEARQLQQAIQDYNTQCLGQASVLTAQPRTARLRLEWGGLAGAAYTRATLGSGTATGFNVAVAPGGPQLETLPLEPFYLAGQRLESSVRPTGGLYADLLFPGRRVAGHAEVSVRAPETFTRTVTTGNPAYPTKTYALRGVQTLAALGVRLLRPVGSGQVLGGLGLLNVFTVLSRNQAEYPGVSGRSFRSQALPVRGQLGYTRQQVGVYLEGGYRWGRFTATAAARYFGGTVTDNTTVNSVLVEKDTGRPVAFSTSTYTLRNYQGQLTLAYRLNRNTDQP